MSFYYGGGSPLRHDTQPIVGTTGQQPNANLVELQQRVDRLNLMMQTLSRLLMAKNLVTEEELNEWYRYVDGLDGSVDGRLKQPRRPQQCPACKRMNPPTAVKCQYCAAEMPPQFIEKTD